MKIIGNLLFIVIPIYLMNQVLASDAMPFSSSRSLPTFYEDLFDWWNQQLKNFVRRNVPEGSRGSKPTRDYLLRLEHSVPIKVQRMFYEYNEVNIQIMQYDHETGFTGAFNKDKVSPRMAYDEICALIELSYNELIEMCQSFNDMEKLQTLIRNKINKPFVLWWIRRKEEKIFREAPMNRDNERRAIFEALDEIKSFEPLAFEFPEFESHVH